MAMNTITAVGGNQLTAETGTLYNKELLMRAKRKQIYMQLGKKIKLPKNSGTIVDVRRFERVAPSSSPSQINEGQTPISTAITVNNYTFSIKRYGSYCVITDQLQRNGHDNSIMEASGVFGDLAGETFDIVTRNDLIGNAGATQYQGGKSSLTDVDNTCKLTVNGIKKAVRTLRGYSVMGFEGGKYECIIHPDAEYDLTNDPDWISVNIRNKGAVNVYGYEVGEIAGCRISVGSNAYINAGGGASTNYTGVKTTNNVVDVYSTFIFAQEAFGVLDIDSDSGFSPKIHVKYAENSGTEDPLGQRNTVGFIGGTDTQTFDASSDVRSVELRHSCSS